MLVYWKFSNQTSLDQMAFLLCFPAVSSCAISGMMALKSHFKQFHNQRKHGTLWLLSGIVFWDARRREVWAQKSLVLRRGWRIKSKHRDTAEVVWKGKIESMIWRHWRLSNNSNMASVSPGVHAYMESLRQRCWPCALRGLCYGSFAGRRKGQGKRAGQRREFFREFWGNCCLLENRCKYWVLKLFVMALFFVCLRLLTMPFFGTCHLHMPMAMPSLQIMVALPGLTRLWPMRRCSFSMATCQTSRMSSRSRWRNFSWLCGSSAHRSLHARDPYKATCCELWTSVFSAAGLLNRSQHHHPCAKQLFQQPPESPEFRKDFLQFFGGEVILTTAPAPE